MRNNFDLSAAEYHADPAPEPSLSASIAHILCNDSPLHAWTAHPRLNPQAVEEEKDIFDLGTVVHALLLEGTNVAEWLPFPDWRTNAAKAARSTARAAGKIAILEKHRSGIEQMSISAWAQLEHIEAHAFLPNFGKPEQTLIWQEENGPWCRARLDWLTNDFKHIYDYKSTGASANPEVVSRTLFGSGWDIQAAFYVRGLKAIAGTEATFQFIVQENYPPYALSMIALGPDVMMLAEKKVIYAIDLWRSCLESGTWPGYPQQTYFASLPPWEEERWLRRELNAS